MVGSLFSANWCSVTPPTTRTHCGGGVIATCRLSMAIASARLRTPSQRSSMLKLSPPRMMCRWLSMRPGSAPLPFRSITRVEGPASGVTSSSRPTAVNAPFVIATALAAGFERSSVVKRPFLRIRSALMFEPHVCTLRSWCCLERLFHGGADILCLLKAFHDCPIVWSGHCIDVSNFGGFGTPPGPVKLADHRICASGHNAGLDKTCNRRPRCHFARIAGCIDDRIDIKTGGLCVEGRKHDTHARPDAGHDERLLARLSDRFDEQVVIPRIYFALARRIDSMRRELG